MKLHWARLVSVLSAATMTLAGTPGVSRGQEAPAPPASTQGYVSREEYDKLKREQDEMRRELEALKRERAAGSPGAAAAPATGAATQADIDAVNESIRQIRDDVAHYHSGESKFALYGDAAFGFTAQRHSPSTFYAGIAPLVLWQPSDRILIEAAADIGVSTDPDGNSSTSFDLTIANATYLVNDNLAIGAGLFVVPFGVYHNHFDPPWINKFPDDPLPFGDSAIAPGSEVGVFAKGAVPLTFSNLSTKLTYDAYVTNGPQLVTTDSGAAGSLNFDDFTDLNSNKAYGGRIGFLPWPNVELGYSIQQSDPNPPGFKRVHALLQAVDVNWRQDVDALYGRIDVRGEYVWSNVGKATYDPDASLGFGPLRFDNHREGGYVQFCYRPAYVDNTFIRNLEFVSRYDFLNTPLTSPGGEHEHRLTFGVDYWLTPQAVLKTAYEFDFRKEGPGADAFLVQFGIRL